MALGYLVWGVYGGGGGGGCVIPLVVVISVSGGVVRCSHVNHHITGGQDSGVSSTHNPVVENLTPSVKELQHH